MTLNKGSAWEEKWVEVILEVELLVMDTDRGFILGPESLAKHGEAPGKDFSKGKREGEVVISLIFSEQSVSFETVRDTHCEYVFLQFPFPLGARTLGRVNSSTLPTCY